MVYGILRTLSVIKQKLADIHLREKIVVLRTFFILYVQTVLTHFIQLLTI